MTIEREVQLFKQRNITPYVSGEIFYDTRYRIWNRNRFSDRCSDIIETWPDSEDAAAQAAGRADLARRLAAVVVVGDRRARRAASTTSTNDLFVGRN